MANIVHKTRTVGSVPTPPSGYIVLFTDSADNQPKYKDSTGSVSNYIGAAGPTGSQGPIGISFVTMSINDASSRIVATNIADNLTFTASLGVAVSGSVTAKTIYLTNIDRGTTAVAAHTGLSGSAHQLATNSVNGFMSSTDKGRFDTVTAGGMPQILTLGDAGSTGTSSSYARADHAHPATALSDATHGTRAGGTLHAQATSGTDGFMSSTDKSRFDLVVAGTAPQTLTLGGSTVTGASSSYARADHAHAVTALDDTTHGSRGGAALHSLAVASGSNGFFSGLDKFKLDATIPAVSVTTQTLGDTAIIGSSVAFARQDHRHALTALDDTTHGTRSGGTTHAVVVSSGSAGFMAGLDKAKLDSIVAATSVTTQTLGDVGAVGSSVLYARQDHQHVMTALSDATHGTRGGGTLHSVATTSTAGFLPAADKATINNFRLGFLNILDFGADPTNATSSRTALDNAIAALPSGGIVFFPAGTYNFGNTAYNITTAHITLLGASRYNTKITTTSGTEDIIQLGQYYITIENMSFVGPGTGENPTKTAGAAINGAGTGFPAYGYVRRCSFFYQFNCILMNNILMAVEDIECRFFKNSGIVVNHNSDHTIMNVVMDNNTGFLPVGSGIDVILTASLLLYGCNVIHANFALNVSPPSGTVPSIKAVNCFFDTSAVGLRMVGAGFVYRSEFTNCWFSSMSTAGVQLLPASAGGVDGIVFVNCDFYNNVGGTTNGIITNANVGKWKLVGSTIAGWTTGINLVAGSAHYVSIIGNTIGAVAAFLANTTGIAIAAGTYKGLLVVDNDVNDNTTPISIAAGVTSTTPDGMEVANNLGHLLKGGLAAITAPVNVAIATETIAVSVRIPANAVTVGQTFRLKAIGVTSGANVCTWRVRAGAANDATQTTFFTSKTVTGAANDRTGCEAYFTIRSATTATAEGTVFAVASHNTAVAAAATAPTVTTTSPWFLILTLSATVGTTAIQVATIEAI